MGKNKKNKNAYYQRGKVSTVQQPTRDKSKDKIYAIILCVFIVFWTVASVLGSIGFFRTSAEEIAEVPTNTITDDGWSISLDGISGARTFNSLGDLEGSICGSYTLEFQRQVDYLILTHKSYTGDIFTVQWSVGAHTTLKEFSCSLYAYDELLTERFNVNINGNIDFIYDSIPYKAVYFSSLYGYPFRVDIDFVDKQGNYVGTLPISQYSSFPNYPASAYQCSFDNRPLSVLSSTGGSDYFTQVLKFLPYDATDDFFEGYEQGKQVGYNDGYSLGYNAGINDSNSYSFSNMIGAVLDGQVNMFMGLFNFELLGVNLSSFFLAILTVCVIITIIKLLM